MPRTAVPGQSRTTAAVSVAPSGRSSWRSVCTAWNWPSPSAPERETAPLPTVSAYPPAGRACRGSAEARSRPTRTTSAPSGTGAPGAVNRRAPASRSSARSASRAYASAVASVTRATSSVTGTGAPFARSEWGRGHTDGSAVRAVSAAGAVVAPGAGGAATATGTAPSGPAPRVPVRTARARAALLAFAVLPRRSCTGPSWLLDGPPGPVAGAAVSIPLPENPSPPFLR